MIHTIIELERDCEDGIDAFQVEVFGVWNGEMEVVDARRDGSPFSLQGKEFDRAEKALMDKYEGEL